MWFKLATADFSRNNLGTMSQLSSTWPITKILNGYTETTSTGNSIPKDDNVYSAIFKLNNNYTYNRHSVSMNSVDITSDPKISYNSSTHTITIDRLTVTGALRIECIATSSNVEEPEPETPVTPTNYTFTINPDPVSATVTLSATGYSTVSGTGSKSITVANGTTVNWSVSADGYVTRTGNWTISGGNKIENIALSAEATDTATLSVTATPADAIVNCYAKNKLAGGGNVEGSNYITVTKATENVTWQVARDGYISNGGQINKLAENVHKDITLEPFSTGNWTMLDTTTFEEVKDYYMNASGKNSGPYPTWKYLLCPITPGKKYRVISTAGQNALLWMFFSTKPDGNTNTTPISKSGNIGMTMKIADEIIAPEGATYMVVNGRINSADYKPTIERLDD